MSNNIFKKGDIVLHRIMGEVVFLRYGELGNDSIVEFTDEESGESEEMRVKTSSLKPYQKIETLKFKQEEYDEMFEDFKKRQGITE